MARNARFTSAFEASRVNCSTVQTVCLAEGQYFCNLVLINTTLCSPLVLSLKVQSKHWAINISLMYYIFHICMWRIQESSDIKYYKYTFKIMKYGTIGILICIVRDPHNIDDLYRYITDRYIQAFYLYLGCNMTELTVVAAVIAAIVIIDDIRKGVFDQNRKYKYINEKPKSSHLKRKLNYST